MTVPYFLLGNGTVAARFLRHVAASGGLPQRVVLNSPHRQRDADVIRAVCSESNVPISEWSTAVRDDLAAKLSRIPGCWLVSVYFGEMLNRAILEAVDGRAVNLHASLLPWNRGANTNVWPLLDGSPAGVSLHAMAPAVDSGPVLARKEIKVEMHDTAGTLYRKLEEEGLRLLAEWWPNRVISEWPGTPQGPGGSHHVTQDFRKLSEYALDGKIEVIDFFNLLRARSFLPYPGLVIRLGEESVRATISLESVASGASGKSES